MPSVSPTSPLHLALFGSTTERIRDARERSPVDDHSWDAVLFEESAGRPLDHDAARRIRRSLTARGRLAVFLPFRDGPGHRQALQRLVVCLSRSGFVILDEDAAPDVAEGSGGVWILARVALYCIRGYRPGDESSISDLFRRSFHVTRDAAQWRWKYEQHPWRPGAPPIVLAWSAENCGHGDIDRGDACLVGQYAAVPMRLAGIEGEDDRVLQLCDIMTAPEARSVGRGPTAVLSRMLRCLYATHAEHRVEFVIGWNTATSRAFALRFNAGHEAEPVAFWTRDRDLPADPGGYRVATIERFGARFDRLFRRLLPAYAYLQRRDARYLEWRYRQPGVRYLRLAAYRLGRLVGWAIFRRRDDSLEWGDALIAPRHAAVAGALLRAALEHEDMQGVVRVSAWFSERPPWWRECLLTLGFERQKEPNDLSLIYGLHNRNDAGRRLERLYYTMGDSDLF